MSFHGGFLGVLLALWLFARNRNKRWLDVTDFVAPLVPLGLAAGRLGNFINGELVGRVTDVPWAMVFPQVDMLPRHPSQLYQLALEGVLLFLFLWWYSSRPRPTGAVSGMFLVGYGALRFIAEYAREPDSFLGLLAGGLSMGQWLSLPMIAAGLADGDMGLPARRQGAADGHRPNEDGLMFPRRRLRRPPPKGAPSFGWPCGRRQPRPAAGASLGRPAATSRSADSRRRSRRIRHSANGRPPPAAARSRGRC